MIQIGDILLCKSDDGEHSCPDKYLTKGKGYMVQFVGYEEDGTFINIECNDNEIYTYIIHNNGEIIDLYKYFYTPEEMRLKKLKTIL